MFRVRSSRSTMVSRGMSFPSSFPRRGVRRRFDWSWVRSTMRTRPSSTVCVSAERVGCRRRPGAPGSRHAGTPFPHRWCGRVGSRSSPSASTIPVATAASGEERRGSRGRTVRSIFPGPGFSRSVTIQVRSTRRRARCAGHVSRRRRPPPGWLLRAGWRAGGSRPVAPNHPWVTCSGTSVRPMNGRRRSRSGTVDSEGWCTAIRSERSRSARNPSGPARRSTDIEIRRTMRCNGPAISGSPET